MKIKFKIPQDIFTTQTTFMFIMHIIRKSRTFLLSSSIFMYGIFSLPIFSQAADEYDYYKYTKKFIKLSQEFLSDYWERTRFEHTGIGLAQIDDLLMLIILIRLILLVFRYNIPTGIRITLISVAAGYVWYSSFISALLVYEAVMYKNSLTYRLGMDIAQLKQILSAKVQKNGYQIRLSNPIGMLTYAIAKGSIYENHRIDFISMAITKVPENYFREINFLSFHAEISKYSIESDYYYVTRVVLPIVFRAIIRTYDQFTTFGLYTYMTRVNKRYCPYLLRWHWTMTMVSGFFQRYLVYVAGRMTMYTYFSILPLIKESQRLNIVVPYREFELSFIVIANYGIVMCQLGFQVFAMLHAVCGQYFYTPFLTENTEMHVGKRDINSIYSGGFTEWQNPAEKTNYLFPKLWYGWFGKGTRNSIPSITLLIITVYIFTPIYLYVRKLLRSNRKKK